jgi:hypothetical protein
MHAACSSLHAARTQSQQQVNIYETVFVISFVHLRTLWIPFAFEKKLTSLTRLKKPEHFGQFWQFDMLRKEALKKQEAH